LQNGLVTAEVGPDGTVTLTGTDGTVLTGLGKLVDGGDCGDSYNYGPPASDVLVEEPSQVQVDVVETGPVRAVLRVTRHYQWPQSLNRQNGCRATEVIDVPVSMLVELRRGEPFVRLRIQFTNAVTDHRLRMHVPLPEAVQESAAEGQFSITTRGLEAEGGGGEYPLPTFPAYSFVSAGKATVLVRDATEYEIVDRDQLALTVLRAVGSISVNVHPLRDEPAASEIPIPGAQEEGTGVDMEFAVIASSAGYRNADAVRLSDHFNADALAVRGRGRHGIDLPPASEGLKLRGENVRLSSLRAVDNGVEVRVVLLSDEAASAVLEGDFHQAATIDLTGRTLDSAQTDGEYKFTLAPWEIRTLLLRRADTEFATPA
jgi:alpha-mannosidase